MFNMENQQGPAGQHRELCSVSCGSLEGGEFGGEGVRVYVCLSPFAVHLKHHNIVNQVNSNTKQKLLLKEC